MAAGDNRVHGDLNNTEVMRETNFLVPDPTYAGKTLAIPESEDDAEIRSKYRPFLTSPEVANSDWISQSELSTVMKMSEADLAKTGGNRLKILVLYGSLRERLDPRSPKNSSQRFADKMMCLSDRTRGYWLTNAHAYFGVWVPMFVSLILLACLSKTMFNINTRKFKSFVS